MVGFEPTHNEVKVHCLTTWLHLIKFNFNFEQEGI
jgi:hypothetical protein